MSLTKKGSRRIVVEGIAYRWVVRPSPTYSQGMAWGTMSFAVELEAAGQSTLVVTLDAPRPDNWLGQEGAAVTPSLVGLAIKQAREQGWTPELQGRSYQLSLAVAHASPDKANSH